MADTVSCSTIGKWIGEQIFQQLTFLWCFTTNIKSLREEEQMLDNATKGLQLQVDNPRNEDNIIIDPEVEAWLKKSKDIKEETSKILSEAANVESDHLKLGDRLSLSKRAKEMTDRSKVLRDQKKFDVIFHPGPSPAMKAVPLGPTFECESRKEIEEEIMTALRGGEVKSRYDGSLGFKFDDAFLEGMRELHVLCIQNYRSLTTLPHPTQSFGKLNTLILDSCDKLETISVVGELVNLEILICRCCYGIEKLPAEMKGLNRLKLLDLSGCERLQSIDRGIISSLIGLEELKMLGSFDGWEERENASIKELEALTNLACLEIDIKDPSLVTKNMPLLSKKIVRFIITNNSQYIPSRFSKGMGLRLKKETRLGDWIEMQLLRDTEYLYLEGGANNVDLAKGQNIRWLRLEECESMKNVVRTSGGSDDTTVFPSIEHLELYSLPELQEICDGPISSTSFQKLKELQLMRCGSLRNLGQLSMAGKDDCLPHLEKLSIWKCEMMEQVFLWNEEEAGEKKTSILITKVFPKLKEVKLYDLPNLTSFYQGIQAIEFPLLTEMELKNLPKLVSFCDWKCEVELPLLRKVEIRKCPNMKNLSLGLITTPNLEAFTTDLTTYVGVGVDVAFNSLKNLDIFENKNPWYDDKISVSLFTGLEKFKFYDCKGSMSLFSSSTVGNLVNLRVLKIISCYEMVKVIEDKEEEGDGKVVLSGSEIRRVVFPKLEELTLKWLPKLVRFCEWKCDVELPSLTKVRIEQCPNMESFSMGFVAAPNLRSVEIDDGGTEDLNEALQQHYLARQEKEVTAQQGKQ